MPSSNGEEQSEEKSPQSLDASSNKTSDEPLQLAVDNLFGTNYKILETIGKGGMGTVYKCLNRINGKIRAIKILHPHLVSDQAAMRRFEAEATAVSRLNSPHIVTIIDMGISFDQRPYLVMEYLEGRSLAELLQLKGKLSASAAIPIFVQICSALSEAHEQGIVHRDIKPSNVILIDSASTSNFVKVVDFGIAKLFPQIGDGTIIETMTGEIFGSPPYMSPEQCLGEKIDYHTDIYSLGCLMHEVLTGKPPLLGDSPMSTMYKQIHESPQPLQGLNEPADLVLKLDQLLSKAMQKSPYSRFGSASELSSALEAAKNSTASGKPELITLMQLRANHLSRQFSNVLGSSKRIFIVLAGLLIICFAIGSCALIPFFAEKDPSVAEQNIDWQEPPPLSQASLESNSMHHAKLREIRAEIARLQLKNDHDKDPELFSAYIQLADKYFHNSEYALAQNYYSIAFRIGSDLLQKQFRDYQAPSLTWHIVSYAAERFAQSLLRQKFFDSAFKYGNLSLKCSLYDSSSDDEYKAFLNEILGVCTARLGGPGNRVNELCDNFVDYINTKKGSASDNREAAMALADIADCYLDSHKWAKALEVLPGARKAWSIIQNPTEPATKPTKKYFSFVNDFWRRSAYARYNMAVSDYKLGLAREGLEQTDEALTSFDRAAKEFENLGGRNDQARAKVLFHEAKLCAKHGRLINSWILWAEAKKAWIEFKRSSHR